MHKIHFAFVQFLSFRVCTRKSGYF